MGFAVAQVAVIDRDVAVRVATFGELGGRAEDEVFAVGGEVLGDVAVGGGAGPGSKPGAGAMPWTSSPPGRRTGTPV